MFKEILSDYFACEDNFLTRIDPRIKMVFVLGAIITILFSRTPALPAIVAASSLFVLLSVGIPYKTILVRLLAPLSIATVILFLQVFFYGQTPLFILNLHRFNLTGYEEGLLRGLLIMGRVAGAVSLIIFLTMTTPVHVLLKSAYWFKIPKTWIEVATMTYRYVFVLIEDTITIKNAQKVRLGYSNLSRSTRSFAELIGSVFIRAYDQSVSAHEAMQLRGYSGSNRVFFEKRFELKDGAHFIILSIILFLLITVNLYWK